MKSLKEQLKSMFPLMDIEIIKKKNKEKNKKNRKKYKIKLRSKRVDEELKLSSEDLKSLQFFAEMNRGLILHKRLPYSTVKGKIKKEVQENYRAILSRIEKEKNAQKFEKVQDGFVKNASNFEEFLQIMKAKYKTKVFDGEISPQKNEEIEILELALNYADEEQISKIKNKIKEYNKLKRELYEKKMRKIKSTV
jgi:hypothetical protein